MHALKLMAAFTFLTSSSCLFSQPIVQEHLHNVSQLSASGWVEVQQDVLTISMTTSRDGVDAALIQRQLQQALDEALTQTKTFAMPGQMDVRTGDFSLYPRYGKDGKSNGWQGSAELVIEGRDFTRSTRAASKIQSLNLGHISFSLSRERRVNVESEAQTLAIERFKGKAQEISQGFGFKSYSLREISVNSNDQNESPRPRNMAMQAKSNMSDASVPAQAGKTAVLITVSGSIQMK